MSFRVEPDSTLLESLDGACEFTSVEVITREGGPAYDEQTGHTDDAACTLSGSATSIALVILSGA